MNIKLIINNNKRIIVYISLLLNILLLLAIFHELERLRLCNWRPHINNKNNNEQTEKYEQQSTITTNVEQSTPSSTRRLLQQSNVHKTPSKLQSHSTKLSDLLISPPAQSFFRLEQSTFEALLPIYAAPAPATLQFDLFPEVSSVDSHLPNTGLYEWAYCDLNNTVTDIEYPFRWPYCSRAATSEQVYQLKWYGCHVLAHCPPVHLFQSFHRCIQIPPDGYQQPPVAQYLPTEQGKYAIHWRNLGVDTLTDLLEFNKHTPKNLYHFNASVYDADALTELTLAAHYIPFRSVRLALDIGAGGGSLSVLLKRKFDVTTLSTVFADWPCKRTNSRK